MTDTEMMDCREPARQIERLRAIMHRLRAPGGCPWDAEQTHESLVPNLIEETYETVDAIRRADYPHLREELGDLLLQVVFHSELAEEAGRHSLDDVAHDISEKLVRRHPHVFADSTVEDTEGVLRQWDEIKRAEKGDEAKPYLHGVGKGLPALPRAAKLQKKAAKVGFDWPDPHGAFAKLREEISELDAAMHSTDPTAIADELGDVFFSAVNVARLLGQDPEVLMAAANAKFERRFSHMESILRQHATPLGTTDLPTMEAAWQEAKTHE